MPSDPTILAFDTSAAHCAVALLMGGEIVAKAHEEMARGQAERLPELVSQVLAEVGAVLDELDAVGVGIGPGNFTGIRIGVSYARGLALGLGIPAIGVSQFEILRGLANDLAAQPLLVTLKLRPEAKEVAAQVFQGEGSSGPAFELTVFASDDAAAKTAPADLPSDIPVFGEEAAAVGWVLGENGDYRPYSIADRPAEPAPLMARIAAKKLARNADTERPAPLYIKPADAAPSRHQPPKIVG